MTSGAGGLAGAAIGLGFLAIGLGVAGNVVRQTQKQLNQKPVRKVKKGRLRRAGIY